MNATLTACQERYHAHLPSQISEARLKREWLVHLADRLMCGSDIK